MTLYERYQDRQLAAARLEAELAAARLQALRGHLQPHFLFNSLHSIAALARTGRHRGRRAPDGRPQRAAAPCARRRRSALGLAARGAADRRAVSGDSARAVSRSARRHRGSRARRRRCPRAAARRAAARGERGASWPRAAGARGVALGAGDARQRVHPDRRRGQWRRPAARMDAPGFDRHGPSEPGVAPRAPSSAMPRRSR